MVLTYLIKYLTMIGKIFIRIWNYYYILNEYQKLLTMLPSIEKYDNTYKFTLQVTSHIDGIAFHWFFLIPQQLTKWILSHRRYTIATLWTQCVLNSINYSIDCIFMKDNLYLKKFWNFSVQTFYIADSDVPFFWIIY